MCASFKEWVRVKGAPGSDESSLREGEEMEGRSPWRSAGSRRPMPLYTSTAILADGCPNITTVLGFVLLPGRNRILYHLTAFAVKFGHVP